MDSDDKILINIFIDKEFKFSQIVDPKITISDLKKIILSNTTIYSLNYIMEYQDREISGLEMLSLKQSPLALIDLLNQTRIIGGTKREQIELYKTIIKKTIVLQMYNQQNLLKGFINQI